MRNHDDRAPKPARRQTPTYLQLVRTPPVAPTGGPRSEARNRVEIVPLGETSTAAARTVANPLPVPQLAPMLRQERRQQWPGRQNVQGAAARLVCPGCGFGARIDIVDLRSRRLHLSCDRCFRMWQDRVREGDTVASGRNSS